MKEYFWLTQELRENFFDVIIPDSVIYTSDLIKGNLSHLDRVTLLKIGSSVKKDVEIDVCDRGLFMISKKVKSVFDLFLPFLEYREICAFDGKRKQFHYFHVPLLPFSDIKTERIRVQDGREDYSLKLSCDTVPKKDILKVRNHISSYVLVSLMVAESIMNMDVQNVRLIPVEIEYDNF